MTYYYAIYYDDYLGIGKVHKASTMKNALAGLRKLLKESNQEGGLITTSQMNVGQILSPRSRPKGYVGQMYSLVGRNNITINFNGKRIKTPGNDYVWYGKGKRKGQLVMADGSLRK